MNRQSVKRNYYGVIVKLNDGKSYNAICVSTNPKGALGTVMSSPETKAHIGERQIVDFDVVLLDYYESIKKDDFLVQTSEDKVHWIITNIADSVVYKVPKKLRGNIMDVALLAYLDDQPVIDEELKKIYTWKMFIWFQKYSSDYFDEK